MDKVILISSNGNSEIVSQVKRVDENNFEVFFADSKYSFQIHTNDNNFICVKDSKTNEVIPLSYLIRGEEIELLLKGVVYKFVRVDEKNKKAQQNIGSKPIDLSGIVKAPMPGTVLKILTEIGSEVKANVPLIIMESMKMELTITAPMNGIVTDISCAVGKMVEMNAILIKLEQGEKN